MQEASVCQYANLWRSVVVLAVLYVHTCAQAIIIMLLAVTKAHCRCLSEGSATDSGRLLQAAWALMPQSASLKALVAWGYHFVKQYRISSNDFLPEDFLAYKFQILYLQWNDGDPINYQSASSTGQEACMRVCWSRNLAHSKAICLQMIFSGICNHFRLSVDAIQHGPICEAVGNAA